MEYYATVKPKPHIRVSEKIALNYEPVLRTQLLNLYQELMNTNSELVYIVASHQLKENMSSTMKHKKKVKRRIVDHQTKFTEEDDVIGSKRSLFTCTASENLKEAYNSKSVIKICKKDIVDLSEKESHKMTVKKLKIMSSNSSNPSTKMNFYPESNDYLFKTELLMSTVNSIQNKESDATRTNEVTKENESPGKHQASSSSLVLFVKRSCVSGYLAASWAMSNFV